MRNLAKKRRAVRVVRGDATKGVTGKPPRDRGRVVTLAAEPTAVDLDLTKTVVIVVDMQNDPAEVVGALPHPHLHPQVHLLVPIH